MMQYQQHLRLVLEKGKFKPDRTGIWDLLHVRSASPVMATSSRHYFDQDPK